MTCTREFVDVATAASLQVVQSAVVPCEGQHVVLTEGDRGVLRLLSKFDAVPDAQGVAHPTVVATVHNRG